MGNYSSTHCRQLAHSSHTYEKSLQTSGGKDTMAGGQEQAKDLLTLTICFSLDMQSN